MNASTNQQAASTRGRRPTYGIVARRLVGSAILLSGTVIFAADLSWSASVQPGGSVATPQRTATK